MGDLSTAYKPTGSLQGDDKPMAMKGTDTGYSPVPLEAHEAAADRTQSATNNMGSIAGSTQSDKMFAEYAGDPETDEA